METSLWIVTLLTIGSAWATDSKPPCQHVGCPNVTLYLGPRWGTKVIYPNYPKLRGPSEQEAKNVNITLTDTGNEVELYADAVDKDRRVPVPKQRPVPDDDSFTVDFYKDDGDSGAMDSYESDVPRLTSVFDVVGLDLMNQSLTGDGLKDKLSSYRSSVLRQTRHLYLNNNNISYLPVLTFPVDLEYALVELRLDNNPLDYLSSYTRFELSRLGNLKILGLAHTGLYYLDALYLPTLEVLDLSGNHLSSVPPALESLADLRHLDLSNNRISSVYGLTLGLLPRLRVLSLAGNRMTYLWPDAFLSLDSLEKVYLNDNLLEHAFQVSLPAETDVYLSGNRWKCDCPLLNLVAGPWPRVADKENVTCVDDSPQPQSPRPVSSLTRYNVRLACVGGRSVWTVLGDGWHTATGLARDYAPDLSTLCALLGLMLFTALVVSALRSARRRVAPLEIPYVGLDNKHPL